LGGIAIKIAANLAVALMFSSQFKWKISY